MTAPGDAWPHGWVGELPLVDHHCHALVDRPLDRAAFELLLGESGRPAPAGCSMFDTNLGLAVRAWCAPALDLPAGAPADAYIARRSELGPGEVVRRLMAGGAARLLVDTGYRSGELASLDQMAAWSGAHVQEVVRLEVLAEEVAASLAAAGAGASDRAGAYAAAFDEAVGRRAGGGAVGWKSVAAYRCGLDLDWSRPSPSEVRAAAAEWFAGAPTVPSPGWRLSHPVLVRHGVWAAVDSGLPVQFHTGFGDTDATIGASDPAWLSGLAAATVGSGASVVLLHTWPHHRSAGYLAQVWPHVYMDVGLALPQVGHRGQAVLAEALELAPWHKVLYSSDAFGLPELYHLGVRTHRMALAAALEPLGAMGFDDAELRRLATLVTSANAERIYPLTTSA